MSRKLILTFSSLVLMGATAAQAAIVPPGAGTLKNAVDAAADGDVLLLQTGNYNLGSDNITVDVGITIRPEDNSAHPVIVLDGRTITLNHTGGTTTLQKLEFTGNGNINTSSARALNVLENSFTDVRISFNSVVGSCYVIGNKTQRTGGYYDVSLDADCYTAGNTFNNLRILSAQSHYFVGNKVIFNYNGGTGINLYAAYAVGNEFIRDLDSNTPTNANADYTVVVFNQPQAPLNTNWPYIANNIFRVKGAGSGPAQAIKSMAAVQLSTKSQLQNNVIDYSQFQWPTQGERGMIWVNANSTVQSNIVLNGSNNSMPAIDFANDSVRTQSDVSYNDCFNNASDCGNADGNINADPDFVDSIDYVLTAGSSPAIDAGPTNDHLNDLDGSRNDMGVHGGPNPIAQYKAQLNPTVTAPYVYPVFQDVQTLSGAQVEVTAIGVARFK
ncbi:hypothetical protein [Thiolapillus sp.]